MVDQVLIQTLMHAGRPLVSLTMALLALFSVYSLAVIGERWWTFSRCRLASAGLLRKLGFQEEGLLREYAFFRGRFQDLRSFSLLAGEYPRRGADQSIT